MDDDDEFGDLYTDVLRPLDASDPHQPPPAPSHLHPPINLQINPIQINDNNSNGDGNNISTNKNNNSSSDRNRVSSSLDSNLLNYPRNDVGEDVRFDIEEGEGDDDSGPVIPGLEGVMNTGESASGAMRERGWEDGDEDRESDSDSEDDLQIVLNDMSHHHHGAVGMEMMGDDDGDGELMIMLNEQDLGGGGDDGGAAVGGVGTGVDGERKEGGDGLAKGGGAVATGGMRIGFGSHGFIQHPYHSQFKGQCSPPKALIAVVDDVHVEEEVE